MTVTMEEGYETRVSARLRPLAPLLSLFLLYSTMELHARPGLCCLTSLLRSYTMT